MIAELTSGFLDKLLLFLRVVLFERLSSKQLRRVALEYALCAAYWSLVFAIVACNGLSETFSVCYVIPAMLAGFFQAMRLYIEHLRMMGDTPLTLSHTILRKGFINQLISWTVLRNDSHGTHHAFAKVPRERISEATAHVYEVDGYEPKLAVFDSYWQAFRDMLPSLADPKVGN
jgi:fatty acid desaturase